MPPDETESTPARAPAQTPAPAQATECVIMTRAEDGRPLCIRTIGPGDEALMRAGIERMSPRSRYLRFFSGGRTPPDWVIERLLDADGDRHLTWGALDASQDDDPGTQSGMTTGTESAVTLWPAIGAVHAFRDAEDPECAEFSVAVLDDWHGLGVGKLLTATILLAARAEGIAEFHVDTLSENRSAIDFTLSLGGKGAGHDGTTHAYTLDVAEALQRLEAECDPPGIAEVFKVMG